MWENTPRTGIKVERGHSHLILVVHEFWRAPRPSGRAARPNVFEWQGTEAKNEKQLIAVIWTLFNTSCDRKTLAIISNFVFLALHASVISLSSSSKAAALELRLTCFHPCLIDIHCQGNPTHGHCSWGVSLISIAPNYHIYMLYWKHTLNTRTGPTIMCFLELNIL